MELIEQLKSIVTERSKNPSFLHHDWFVDLHLSIVEKIALELCDVYTDADRDIVRALVWVHDYGKILDMNKEHELNHASKELLKDLGFSQLFTETVGHYLEVMESKMEVDLHGAPIEVKIVSSADAAAHMIGPFFSIYWKEFNTKSIKELMEAGRVKLAKDWDRKIVLPEVKEAFQGRHDYLLEQNGDFPNKFLN